MKSKLLLYLVLYLLGSYQLYGQGLVINEFMSSNSTGIADEDGENSDWIEIYNPGPGAVDLQGYGLSDDRNLPLKWQFPAITVPANSFLLVFASDKNRFEGPYLHTNFKIGAEGETLLISTNTGTLLDSISASVVVPANISYGRKPNGSSTFGYFPSPTPGFSNNGSTGYGEVLNNPTLSQPAGFYPSSFQLTMTAQPGTVIRYTLDGSEPTESSPVYTGSITIASRTGDPNVLTNIRTTTPDIPFIQPASEVFKGTPVRARAFKEGAYPSKPTTRTYFVDPGMTSRYTMPVFSVVTSAANLFDPNIGIYVPGNGYDGVNFKTSNFFQEGDAWERPAHLEMFMPNGTKVFNLNVGTRINGNFSTRHAQKALRFYARKDYDTEDYFNYRLFPQKSLAQYKTFILRNAGGDFGGAYMRDFLEQGLVSHLAPIQAYRPALMFINGEFWGIHDMRERFDRWYFEKNYGINKDSIDILEANKSVKEGDNVHYVAMLNFAKSNNLATQSNYNQMKTRMDVDNFVSYWVAEMIVNNRDWVNSNVQYFRKKTSAYIPNAPYGQDGRWRWIFWDMDLTFKAPEEDNFATTVDAVNWGTDLIRALLANPEFKNNFINQFADQFNTCFKTEHVIKRIDSLAALLEPEMAGHIARWSQPGSVNTWKTSVEVLRDFARKRPNYMRSFVIQRFNLNGTSHIELDVNDPAMGKVKINTITIDQNTIGLPANAPVYPWMGTYFKSVSIPITAIPNPGYRFAGWANPALPNTPTINVIIDRDTSFTALFELDPLTVFKPTPFDLSTGSYSFNSWPASSAAGTYPPNMVFQRGGATTTDLLLADPMDIDYTAVYNATSQTRMNGLGADGFAFINTGTNPNLGTAVLGLKTTGKSNITVSWKAGTVSTTPRDFRIRMQYKIGAGTWVDVPGPVEYTRNATAGHFQTFSDINLSALTDQAVNNKPAVFVRWKYYNADPAVTSGARSQLRVDDITVTSTAAGAIPTVYAGADQTLTLPTNFVTIHGSANDTDGSIASYLWTKVAGPVDGTMSNTNTMSLSLSNLVEGVYSFRFKVTDNDGNIATDLVTVKVLPANAKPVISLVSPANNALIAAGDQIVLTANASDADGTISKVQFFRGNVLLNEMDNGPYTFTISNVTAGTYAFTAVAFDDKGASTTSSVVNVTVSSSISCSASGTILREVWIGVDGESVSNIPVNSIPSFITYPTILETPSNETDLYGSRLRGYLCPPTTGNYTFWIASDNSSELWVSTDANPANKVKIASVTGNTTPREWGKYPSQQSTLINLVAGQKYYVEVLHKESSGGDNLAVGWQLPNGSLERPIPGSRLSPFILPSNVSPTVSITSPANGAVFTVGANITVTANAADSDGAIARVEFYRGNTLIDTDISFPYSAVFTNAPAGTHSLTAKAIDNSGGVTTSNPVFITVGTANQPPTVSIYSPANNATFTAGTDIDIEANAADVDGFVVKVQFYRGDILLNEDFVEPYSAFFTDAPAGVYAITAKAIDNSGAVTTSNIININVVAPGNCTATGTLTREQWNNVVGVNVTDIPVNTPPSSTGTVTLFEGPTNIGDLYGARYRGYLCAPLTGNYVFWIASDNNSELWLSTNDDPANRVRIASVTGNTNSRQWDKYPSQQSVPILLLAGHRYYVEVLHKEATGGDNLAVGWQLPNTILERPIPGTRLSPFFAGNNAPTVSITSPANNALFNVGDNITISASALDSDGQIDQVEFFNGNTSLGVDFTAPYSIQLTNVQAGTYQLTARAIDNAQAVTTSAIVSITVSAPNQAPAVSITSPANNAVYALGATLIVTADASDPDGSIASVEFFRGAVSLGIDNTAPYGVDVSGLAAGTYQLTARAMDNSNATTTSAIINIVVNTPPTVSLSAPINDEVFPEGSIITISATAGDVDGSVSQVEFFSGPTSLGIDNSAPFSIQFSNVTAGSYQFTAVATDNRGTSTTSSPVNVFVNKAPTVSITSPANGSTFNQGDQITIEATAADEDGTIAQVEFFDGTTSLGVDDSAPYSTVVQNANGGVYNVVAVATDNKGGKTTSGSVQLTVNYRPVVSITSPANFSNYTTGDNVLITAQASDPDGSIAQVEFFNGGISIGVDNAAPYEATLTNAEVGSYVLTAVATDNQGLTTISTVVNVIVTLPNQLPTVSLTSPSAGAVFTVGENITLSATASDADGNIIQVEFFNGNLSLGVDNSAPYSIVLGNAVAGSYNLQAVATDDKNGTKASEVISILVNAKPTVSITTPAANAVFTAGANLTVAATASDADGSVTQVEFFRGGVSLGVDNAAPYSVVWNSAPAGNYNLTAVATDNQGATTTSTVVNITVNPVNSGCTASGTILREEWANVAGKTIAEIPLSSVPTSSSQLTAFQGPSNVADKYAARYRGYICAPLTGSYTFFLVSDDEGELYISPNDDPANKVKQAYIYGAVAYPGQWEKFPTQKTVAISLVAGQRYYVEALHKENTGGDNLIVGWRTPAMGANATPVVVPGAVLSPYILSNARQTWLDEPELKPTMNVLTASPNPFSQNLVISFTSSETGKAECDLYDLKGVNVQQLYKGKVTAGEQMEIHLDGQSLKEGMYLIRMHTETQSTHVKVVLVR